MHVGDCILATARCRSGACTRGGIPVMSNTFTPSDMTAVDGGIAVDQGRRIWMACGYGKIAYGHYNKAGVLTQTGAKVISGAANLRGLAIDPRGFWFCTDTSASTNRVMYGTYNLATGEPTLVGTLNVTGSFGTDKSRNLFIDPSRGLWWCMSNGYGMCYGTYNTGTGVPTQGGFSANGALTTGGVATDIAVLWYATASGLYRSGYNTTTGAPGSGTLLGALSAQSEPFGIVPGFRYLFAGMPGVNVYSYDASGNLTSLGSTGSAYMFTMAADTCLRLLFGAGGTTIYTGLYC